MKLLLSTFEQLSGLKINFHKIEVFCFGKAKDHEEFYSQLFGCAIGKYLFRYLGIWDYPCISGNYLTKIGSALKRELRKDLVVGKGNC
jgi:hypothetical protein